jgi:hypothetical protein
VARITLSAVQFSTLERTVRGLVRSVRRLAFAAAAAVVLIALMLWREDGIDSLDAVAVLLLLTPAAILLFFTRGVLALVSLPDRLQRVPGESQEQLSELARIAANARTAKARSTPLLLWRLRGTAASLRDVAGITLSLRVFTPAFLAATALAALACVILVAVGLIALIVLAVG